jgi:phosphoserine phosphatase RsbX
LPQISASIIPVLHGDLLILATDGVRSGFADSLDLNGHPQQIADSVLKQHWRGNDDALVLVARFNGHEPTKPG